MRGQAFKSTPSAFAMWQSWISPKHPQYEGIPLGYDLRTGKVVMFYPWTLPTHSTTFGAEGEKNSGKSTFLKVVMPRLLGLQAKDAYGNPTLMRGRISSRKSEEGVAEFAPLSTALASPVYDIGQEGSINLFGLFTEEADLIEVAINIAQEVAGHNLPAQASIAIMVAMRKLFESSLAAISPTTLEVVLRQLTLADFADYHRQNQHAAIDQFKDELVDRPQLLAQLQLDIPEGTIDESSLWAARQAADCFSQLVNGNYGRAFGGRNTLYEVLTQQVVTLDWETLPVNAQSILEAVLMKAEASAIVKAKRGLKSGRDLSLIIPHIDASDEEGGAMKSLMHARATADRQNKSRAYPTASFRAYQYYGQITQAGNVGSEIRSLGQEIENGVGARIIFRQPNDTDFLQRFARLGMSDSDIELLPQLEPGQAFLWLRDHPPLLFQTVITAAELPLVQSNSARTNMANAIPVWSSADFRERAETVGLTTVGEPYRV